MSLQPIYQQVASTDLFLRAADWCRNNRYPATSSLQFKGVVGSIPAFLLQFLNSRLNRPLLCILPTEEAAAYLQSDLEQLVNGTEGILLLPPTGVKPYDEEQIPDASPLIQRADVIQQLMEGYKGMIVTSIPALYELLPPAGTVRHETIVVSIGEIISVEHLSEQFVAHGFEPVEFVERPGEMAIRGGIVDIYPFSGEYPIRIEFFGDEIDSIREFDAKTQRSVSRLMTARLVPNIERQRGIAASEHTTLFEYLPEDALIVTFDETRSIEYVDELFAAAKAEADKRIAQNGSTAPEPPGYLYLDGARLEAALLSRPRLMFGSFVDSVADEEFHFDGRPQPEFRGNMALLRGKLGENARQNIQTFILCDSHSQESRLRELLEEEGDPLPCRLLVESLHEGFEVPSLSLAVYTDHQIFSRYHRPTARKRRKQQGGLTPRELQNLKPGDFVVHVDHGIGKFTGMQQITVRGKQQEAVRVLFAGEDVLYVNINALHKLFKYSGREGHQPKLTRLGSGQWEKTKSKTKKRVKDIARDLIQLYARRKASQGYAFSRDTIWQRELEASFQFEDTPDQAVTSEAVKQDMEQTAPMDRLVCGDVGFGKTEIAVRAAFKAVQDGKQVAVLVPTTILSKQHYDTFTSRLANFPVRIESISRFKSTAEQKSIIEAAAKGEIDILIGTHRIASKDIAFRNLGLLIVDEEQRFGVSVKERLRKLRAEVDTLTLTATPIPRTLQFSLLGARDLSIISTPPPNRQPIFTEIHTFDKDLIRDAILYETNRGGQVFFIHNRVQTIDEIAIMLRAMIPDIRIRTAHGQMASRDLERVMMDFVDKKFDVLVSTNIIESGLDISNANTIVINHAERFGLSELHQLRGRVGRSDRKAFCYLLVPSIHTLTREARQRLQAVEEFSDLGSGFNIAMRDLDIRGAGNLLGAEQTGFIDEVGFETYHKILDEAVRELQAEEFTGLFDNVPIPPASETIIDVDEDTFIPEEYLSNNVERLNIYRRLSEAADEAALDAIRDELQDRFGPVTEPIENLFCAMRIKIAAEALRLSRITYKNQRLFLEVPPQDADQYFYDSYFHPLLERVAGLDRRYVLKDTDKRLRIIIQDVPDLSGARAIMEKLQLQSENTAVQ